MAEDFPYVVDSDTYINAIASKFFKKLSGQDLLNYPGNKNRILMMFSDVEKKAQPVPDGTLVKAGTLLILPGTDAYREPEAETETNKDVVQVNDLKKPFWSKATEDFLNQKKIYFKDFETPGFEKKQMLLKSFTKVYALAYSRALNALIELSPYILDGYAGVARNGGNFGFSLVPIEGKVTSNVWEKSNVIEYNYKTDLQGNQVAFYSKSNFYKNGKRIDLYFEKVLNPQDVVFIKFDEDFEDKVTIDLQNPSDDYDMIGLIDSIETSISLDVTVVNSSVNISGRDLMKVFIEDGVYFYAVEFIARGALTDDAYNQFIQNFSSIKDKQYAKRIFGFQRDLYGIKTIKELLDLVMERLVTSKYVIRDATCFLNAKNGIWDFVFLDIEKEAGSRTLMDGSLPTMTGSLFSFFMKLIREPFVEMIFDTYGSKYRIIVRTPPYLKQTILNNYTLKIDDRFYVSENTRKSDSETFSWFKLEADAIFMGNKEASLLMLPAIFLEEYAKVYGCRALMKQSNYLYFSMNENGKNTESKDNLTYQQVATDLKFMILSNMCNQFLKSGSISLKNAYGIKRGINIYNPDTDMIYLVDSYRYKFSQNENSAEVTVTRGIKFSAIDNYFNILKIETKNNKISSVTFDKNIFNKLLNGNFDE